MICQFKLCTRALEHVPRYASGSLRTFVLLFSSARWVIERGAKGLTVFHRQRPHVTIVT
ncbi:hypothetical protein AG1IA_06135 [Rhizoctonia solani AG-1 IA]|uniref:Uncharacterized protein n=1 Tax=Thanatephorus cucumeris (strain AG1-IA) TaxID=983506 RepID=L8WU37_THACA|nr:hypothetical protein AG1IA_06135 [Rhizoctonia solani AG-1 IA]